MSLVKLMDGAEEPNPVEYVEALPTTALREVFNEGMFRVFRKSTMVDLANEDVLAIIASLENRITILEDALRSVNHSLRIEIR